MTLVLIAVAGALGACVRAVVAQALTRREGRPAGILAVNVAGSFALGLLAGAGPREGVRLVVGVGFLGALTTFSTFALDVVALARERRTLGAAVLYLAATIALTLAAAALGLALT